jgi:hypothetical protein
MRHLLFTAATLLLGCNASLAQVSTIGTTAMGLSSTPGTIVISPLNGPSPYSSTTQPGVPDTTLAPVPLASDPTIPGTVVTCSTPIGVIAPGIPTVPATSMSAVGGTIGSMPSTSALPNPASASGTGSTATMMPSAAVTATAIPVPVIVSTTGTISPTTQLGSSSTTVCSAIPGGPPTNGAALSLTTPEIPPSPPPGTIQPEATQLVSTSIDPQMAVVPTPNTPACAESMTMNLATPGTMAPANATGAAASPGVSPASPSGC